MEPPRSSGVNGTRDLHVTYSRSAYQKHHVLPEISQFLLHPCMMHTSICFSTHSNLPTRKYDSLIFRPSPNFGSHMPQPCMLMSIAASSEELLFKSYDGHCITNYSSLCGLPRLYRSGGCFPGSGYTLVRTALDENQNHRNTNQGCFTGSWSAVHLQFSVMKHHL